MKSVLVYSHAHRMKILAMNRAKALKISGAGWRHKRLRAIRDALYYREAMRRFK